MHTETQRDRDTEGKGENPCGSASPLRVKSFWKSVEKKEQAMGIIARIWNKVVGGASKPGLSGALRAGATMTLKLPGGAKMEMVWCPPGSFMMGSPEDENGHWERETLHPVTLAEGFWMAKYPVTQKQWKSVMRGNPSHFKGSRLPVEHVSWFDSVAFCRKAELSLPSEAQWEYACRAGSTGAYAGRGDLRSMGWYSKIDHCHSTQPVGQKSPNAWGLYDMHGNVAEWCMDVWGKKPRGVPFDPKLADSHDKYVVSRGGSIWSDCKEHCRSACCIPEEPDFHEEYFGEPIKLIGFRPVARQGGGGVLP